MNKSSEKVIIEADAECKLCHGTECLTQFGILSIYLLARKIPLAFFLSGIVLGVLFGKLWFTIAIIGVLITLAGADFRLVLYPVAALAALCGKKMNCPKCNKYGGMFKRS